jgi:DNA-binding transcriptional ArsR family regulator
MNRIINKLEILSMLNSESSLPSSAIASRLNAPVPIISQHLSRLSSEGKVISRRDPITKKFLWSISDKREPEEPHVQDLSPPEMTKEEIQLYIRSEIDKGVSELRTELLKTISLLTSYNQPVKPLEYTPAEADKQLELKFKPRITVIGLLPRQERDILNEFNEILDVRFIPVDDTTRLKDKIKNSDAVFVMIKFINHTVSNVAKNHSKYVPVNGGISDLSDAISNFYMEL